MGSILSAQLTRSEVISHILQEQLAKIHSQSTINQEFINTLSNMMEIQAAGNIHIEGGSSFSQGIEDKRQLAILLQSSSYTKLDQKQKMDLADSIDSEIRSASGGVVNMGTISDNEVNVGENIVNTMTSQTFIDNTIRNSIKSAKTNAIKIATVDGDIYINQANFAQTIIDESVTSICMTIVQQAFSNQSSEIKKQLDVTAVTGSYLMILIMGLVALASIYFVYQYYAGQKTATELV